MQIWKFGLIVEMDFVVIHCIFVCISVDDGDWLAFMHISLNGMTEKDTVNE